MRTQLADPSYAAHARQAAAPSWFFEHSFGHRWVCVIIELDFERRLKSFSCTSS
jgi:hypothetical protein